MKKLKLEVEPRIPMQEMTGTELMRFRDTWQDQGSCYKTFSDAFFPTEAGVPEAAAKICGACPVKNVCLAWATVTKQRDGVWGGVRFGRPKQIEAKPRGKKKVNA